MKAATLLFVAAALAHLAVVAPLELLRALTWPAGIVTCLWLADRVLWAILRKFRPRGFGP